MTGMVPLSSIEARWFYADGSAAARALEAWFFGAWPIAAGGDVPPPAWQGRAGGEPDRYLVVAGAGDMNIKWREGLLQVKGRVAVPGTQLFGGVHAGRVEHWVKWSSAGLPSAWRDLFGGEPLTVAVAKSRAMRKFALSTFTNEAREVAAEAPIDRGVAAEITRLEFDGAGYVSLGFEAFPDDAAMADGFHAALDACLGSLTAMRLEAGDSDSYASWLSRRVGGRG